MIVRDGDVCGDWNEGWAPCNERYCVQYMPFRNEGKSPHSFIQNATERVQFTVV